MIKSTRIQAAAKTIATQIEAANMANLYKKYVEAGDAQGVKMIIDLVTKTMDDKAQIARDAISGARGDRLRMNDAIIASMAA